jgi:hypothetical protein
LTIKWTIMIMRLYLAIKSSTYYDYFHSKKDFRLSYHIFLDNGTPVLASIPRREYTTIRYSLNMIMNTSLKHER